MKTHYGLLYVPENTLLGFTSSANPEDGECIDVMFSLDAYSKRIWVVEKQEIAEKARITNTPWYNAGYETPENTYKAEDLKVVKITIEAEYGN